MERLLQVTSQPNQPPVTKIRASIGTAVILGLELTFMDKDNAPTTAYLQTYHPGRCAANCKFCSQARDAEAKIDKIARGLYLPYDAEVIISRLAKATKRQVIKRICIQTMNYPKLIDELLWLVRRLKAETFAPISVSIYSVPAEQLQKFKDAGVDKIVVPLDAANEKIFDDIKGANVQGPYRWKGHIATLEAANNIMGKGNVGTHLMIGLGETEAETIELIGKLNEMNIYCALFAFTPLRGTKMEKNKPPNIESYRRVKLANYLINHNLTKADKFKFNEKGEIVDYGVRKDILDKTIGLGEPFMTSGCPNCNRPFANETPEKTIYNFPTLPKKEEMGQIKKQVETKKD
jgi:lipoyl synthase